MLSRRPLIALLQILLGLFLKRRAS